jgi:hypothetical protein
MSTELNDIEWPSAVRSLFWEYDVSDLDGETDRDLILRRVLSEGNWETIQWLRGRLGDAGLRQWIEARDGDILSPRQLRFWELVLDLPSEHVDEWVAFRRSSVWTNRARS